MQTLNEWLENNKEEWWENIIKNLPKGTHYLAKCDCGETLGQCRCGSPQKITMTFPNSCDKCKKG